MARCFFAFLIFYKQILGVDYSAVIMQFKMQMVSGGVSGGADFCNNISGFDLLSRCYKNFAAMGIKSLISFPMADYKIISVTGVPEFNFGHNSLP